MAEKINIDDLMVETYSDKTLKAYSEMIADPKSVFGLGSAAAGSSLCGVSMALRALRMTASEDADMLHAEKDLEKLRVYFLHLIDEENKAKKPLEKLLKQTEPKDEEVEAAYRTACCIIDEIFYMSVRMVETLEPIADKICPCAAPMASAAIHFAKCSMDAVRIQKAVYSRKMNEPVFARTTLREPEIAIENNAELFNGLIKKFESADG
jgi:formiminotetrahydrofolate cyclodeaminase